MTGAALEDVTRVWERVEAWLAPFERVLAPGCTDDALRGIEEATGLAVPSALAASLRRHDGEADDEGGLVGGLALLGCSDIVDEWRGWTEIAQGGGFEGFERDIEVRPEIKHDRWWNVAWIPFVGRDGFNLCLDLDPGPAGGVGQVILMDHERGPGPVLALDLATWLERWAAELEAGVFEWQEGGLLARPGHSSVACGDAPDRPSPPQRRRADRREPVEDEPAPEDPAAIVHVVAVARTKAGVVLGTTDDPVWPYRAFAGRCSAADDPSEAALGLLAEAGLEADGFMMIGEVPYEGSMLYVYLCWGIARPTGPELTHLTTKSIDGELTAAEDLPTLLSMLAGYVPEL